MNPIVKFLLKLFLLLPASWITNYPLEPQTPNYSVLEDTLKTASNKYQHDFIYYCHALEQSHPNVNANFAYEDYINEKQSLYRKLENIDDKMEFCLLLQELNSKLKDAHTQVEFPIDLKKTYPLEFDWFGDSLYIMAVSEPADSSLLGTNVKEINGYSIQQIKEKIFPICSNDNRFGFKHDVKELLKSAEVLKYRGIVSDNYEMSITTSEGKKFSIPVVHALDRELKVSYFEHSVTEPVWPFGYNIVDEEKLCYSQIGTFSKSKMNKDFSEYIAEMFTEMEKKDVKKLILDFRYNQGGDTRYTNMLLHLLDAPKDLKQWGGGSTKISELMKLSYPDFYESGKKTYEEKYSKEFTYGNYGDDIWDDLVSKEFNVNNPESEFYVHDSIPHFNGEVYVFIGKMTYSAGNWFATLVKDNGLFKIIGEPGSQKPTSFGDKIYVKLPKTKTVASISYKYFQRPDKTRNDEMYTYPDVEIVQTWEQWKNYIDPCYDWVINHTN